MIRRVLSRSAAAGLIGPYLALASALAPAHVHEADADHDHAVVHSHFAPHHYDEHDYEQDGGPSIDHNDHDDDHVVWLDGAALHQAPFQLSAAPTAILVGNEAVRTDRHWSVTPFDDAAPVHGPPRPASPFRGPPSPAV